MNLLMVFQLYNAEPCCQAIDHRVNLIEDVETIPKQQKRGLGRAVLFAGLNQLQEWGADTAMLIIISTNTPAVNLYTKMGFEPVEILEYASYEKQMALS
jgi:ribosomal protein S18 acetylase RimI-like enzyme